ncbi:peptidoglycan-binding protein [Streptomyces sp. ST2-7A]|nr:peptidoglycan-binding protein [Streptomyces sp. ST2-7A]
MDGVLGPATDPAVRSFQRQHFGAGGMDGIVGPRTRRYLR